MVQMFYYETVGKSCRRLLHRDGSALAVDLHPVDGYAATAPRARWLVEFSRAWSLTGSCRVTEVRGPLRQRTVRAKACDRGDGRLEIRGTLPGWGDDSSSGAAGSGIGGCDKFRQPWTGSAAREPANEFRLRLTTAVSAEDFQVGYCLTGTVERAVTTAAGGGSSGCAQEMITTHFAAVKRKGY